MSLKKPLKAAALYLLFENPMQEHFITHNKSKFHYRQFGKGARLLFCFHGYGRDSYTFGFLGKVLGTRYTIIAIDAPYHGHTEWDDPVFQVKDLVQVLEKIGQAVGKDSKKISLLGYSMGGRIALALTQVLAHKIERVVLLAPDGLKVNFWHWFSTHTWAGNKIFDYTVHHPAWLLKAIKVAEKSRLMSTKLTGFVRYYLDDNEERFILYSRWIIMKKFKPRLSFLKRTITKNKIKVRMLFGKYDPVIHHVGGQIFLKNIEEYATVKMIEAGHDILREWHSAAIADLFND